MDWELIKSGLKKGLDQVQRKSVQAYEYVKSDDFQEKVKSGYDNVKQGVGTVVDKIKGNEQVQVIGQKSKEIFVEVKNSEFVHNVKEKSTDIARSIVTNPTVVNIKDNISQKVDNLTGSQIQTNN